VHGTESTIPTLSTTESFDFDERHHSNDSADSFPPPMTPPASASSPAAAASPLSYSPKQTLQKKSREASPSPPRPDAPVTASSTVPFSSGSSLTVSSSKEEPEEEQQQGGGEDFNPIAVTSVSIAAVEIHSSYANDDERPSDVYSLHSDGIPEHDEEEENNNDDELLTGDGSKPVGCSSCSIQ
jgi:hypothetical protein